MTRSTLAALALAWYVVTYSGTPVAGPFTNLQDCSLVAEIMALQQYNVSAICRSL